MKAEELRIGNFVQDKKGREIDIVRVSNVSERHLNFWEESVYQPIPLNEEWLIRFQWTLHKSDMYWMSPFSKELTITKYATTEPVFYFVHENYQVGLPDIKLEYVHQLQNLYFCLTGQELTLSPPHR